MLFSTLVSLFLATFSFADQCAYQTKESAEAAVALLTPGTVLMHFCEPCANYSPQEKEIITVETAVLEEIDGGAYYGVAINGRLADTAYFFIRSKTASETEGFNTYTNLAKKTGCPARRVSETITD